MDNSIQRPWLKRGENHGNRGGPGRSPKHFREWCRDGIYKAQTVEVMVGLIQGVTPEQVGVDDHGQPIYRAAKARERIMAAQFLAGYAYGAPKQTVEVEDGRGAIPLDKLIDALLQMKRNMDELNQPAPMPALPPGDA